MASPSRNAGDLINRRRDWIVFRRRFWLRRPGIGVTAAKSLKQIDAGDQTVAFKNLPCKRRFLKIHPLLNNLAAILQTVAQTRLREIKLVRRRFEQLHLCVIFGVGASEIGERIRHLLRGLQQRFIVTVDRLIIFRASNL